MLSESGGDVMRKLLVSDFDGTLYQDFATTKRNLKAVKKFREEGNLFVIATGRSLFHLREKLKEFPFTFDYLILNHGAVLVDSQFNPIDISYFSKELVAEILNFVAKKEVLTIRLHTWEKEIDQVEDGIVKIMLEFTNKELALSIAQELNQQFPHQIVCYALPGVRDILVEVLVANVNKLNQINTILKLEDMKEDAVLTVGDGENDRGMIEAFDGYWIKHGGTYKKAGRDHVCTSVFELLEQQ